MEFFKNKKNLILIGVALVIFALLTLAMHSGQNKAQRSETLDLQSKYQSLSTNIDVINKKLDQRMVQLENQLKQEQSARQNLANEVKSIEQNQQQIATTLSEIQDSIKKLNGEVQVLKSMKTSFKQVPRFKPQPVRITAITISNPQPKPVQKKKKVKKEYLKLPDGSIVSGTVVTGIYAPVTSGQWLPTLINVDEAFYGPNDTRVPLKNCKVLAKAQGDYVTQRAYIDVYRLSCVLPNGQAVSFKIKGYIADNKDSALGVHGKLISVTGRYIAGSFLTAFLQGLSSALSQSETSTTITSTGASVTNVTGNTARYAGFAGSSAAFGKLAAYYQGKLDKLIDMIYVPSGRRVWIVIQKGTVIKGYLPKYAENSFGGVD